ncbi:MAG: hypothetical protein U1E05_27865 [Patescibacteria group bacterium]|nr:hypothetical protein [Patescibacteria group bacterium]
METKSDIYRRLEQAGQWAEASRYREEVRAKLRVEGQSKLESNNAAWRAMAVKYPATPISRALATMLEPTTAVEAPPPRVPPVNHCIYGVANLDLQIWSDEYDVDLADDAEGFVASLMAYYWQAGMQGVLPRPDVFGD